VLQYAELCYAEWHYAKCRQAVFGCAEFHLRQRDIMPSVIIQRIIMLGAIIYHYSEFVTLLSVIMECRYTKCILSVCLSFVMLSVTMLSVIRVIVFSLIVVAPSLAYVNGSLVDVL
jgi:hypothetical protein